MASERIRVGVVGANIHRGWAPRSHLPALVASPDFATAVSLHRFIDTVRARFRAGESASSGNRVKLASLLDLDPEPLPSPA